GAARIRHSLRPLNRGGRKSYLQTSGANASRECRHTFSVIVRLDRTTQYPRATNDRTEKPRRTGSSTYAEDDSCVWSGASHRHRERSDLSAEALAKAEAIHLA